MCFTYLFKWVKLNKNYYGVRYKDNALPESLCTTYFSSSKYVKEFIKENGLPDIVEVRRQFDCKIKAKRWEEKVIRRLNAIKKESWLNKGNNNSFKDVVCDEQVKRSISKARKGQSFGILYNNGVINKFFKKDESVPVGWEKGKLLSQKQKNHIEKLNREILTPEKRKIASIKVSKSLTGKKKPPSHGVNVSKATKGKPKPWNQGDKNVSKRDDVRKKISESWKNRVMGKWYTNSVVNKYIKPGEQIPEGFRHGRSNNKNQHAV